MCNDLLKHIGIRMDSEGHLIEGNLVAGVIWPGGYHERVDAFNLEWTPGIDLTEAKTFTLRDNVVAGCQRAGYQLNGMINIYIQ